MSLLRNGNNRKVYKLKFFRINMNKQSEKYRKRKNLGKIHPNRIRYILPPLDVSLDLIGKIEDGNGDDILPNSEFYYMISSSSEKFNELNFDRNY